MGGEYSDITISGSAGVSSGSQTQDSVGLNGVETPSEKEKSIGSDEGSGMREAQAMVMSKYGDPQSPFKVDNKFYGHYLPEHFKKTNIISTKGRVR